MHNDDNRWQTIFIEYFLYVYGNRQAVDGHDNKTPDIGVTHARHSLLTSLSAVRSYKAL